MIMRVRIRLERHCIAPCANPAYLVHIVVYRFWRDARARRLPGENCVRVRVFHARVRASLRRRVIWLVRLSQPYTVV